MSENGNIDIVGLKQHLLSMAEFKYEKNEIIMLAQICASMQSIDQFANLPNILNFYKLSTTQI